MASGAIAVLAGVRGIFARQDSPQSEVKSKCRLRNHEDAVATDEFPLFLFP